MPAFAPPDKPLEEDCAAAEDAAFVAEAAVAPVEDAPGLDDGVGALKSSDVTLKHGTCCVKSFASTNVYK